MSGPLIFVTTARIKDGKLDDFKRFVTQLLENVQAKEQELMASMSSSVKTARR
ncbi:hypothetical protein [Arthrobacter cavernae]|uniref:Uncharacterized protein n=1 Tax=Arthrobacter cavernae TaxID=2817681 RepID=A0A939HH94_9MICC|nr:hypothetical protein [Arthrobacter cavernae]MBO1269886.1 hypothetical protein [Arthrobacter cavernae]